jgi:hypothetical protein
MLALWGAAHAQTVNVDIDQEQADKFGLNAGDLERDLNTLLEERLNLADPDSYIAKFANAAAMSTKGLGVDYASNPKKFVVGGSIGPAVSGVPFSLDRAADKLPDGGYAFMASGLAGVNLGVFTPGKKGPLNHLMVYVSGFYLNPPGDRQFDAEVTNFGAHAQLKLGGPVKAGPIAEWGGIDLTAGYEISSYKLSLGSAWPISTDIDPATVTWKASGTYDIGAKASTIPLEISTNLKITVITGYLGGGFDLMTSSATSTASLSGPVSATAPDGSGGTIRETLGTAGASLDGAGVGDPQAARIFGGAQVNASVLKVYGQLNLGFNRTYGAHVGVRIAL